MQREVFLKNLGERIRIIREEKGITQKNLANTIGKDQQSIQRLETGRINPSIYYLTEIATGLEVPVTQLLEGI